MSLDVYKRQTAFIASTTMACLYVLVKKYLSGTTVVNKSLRFLLVITGFSSILTLCNYLFITPIYFGGLWFTDVIGWATLESFIPGLPFDLGYGADVYKRQDYTKNKSDSSKFTL